MASMCTRVPGLPSSIPCICPGASLLHLVGLVVLLGSAQALLLQPVHAQAVGAEADTTVQYDGRFERVDPQDSHLFVTATARPIGSDGFYLSGIQLFLAQVGVGFSETISVQAGALILPGEHFGQILVAMPKVTFMNRRSETLFGDAPLAVALDAEIMAARSTSLKIDGYGVGGYYVSGREHRWDVAVTPRLLATYGTSEAALTAGLGVPIGNRDDDGLLTAMLGGEVQVREGLKLLSENHVYFNAEHSYTYLTFDAPGQDFQQRVYSERGTRVLLSGGLRFFWDHFAVEAAAQMSASTMRGDEAEVWPLLSISYRM